MRSGISSHFTTSKQFPGTTTGKVPKCLTLHVAVHSCPWHPSSAMGTGQTGSAARKGVSPATCRAAALGKWREEKARFSLNLLPINLHNMLCTFGQKAQEHNSHPPMWLLGMLVVSWCSQEWLETINAVPYVALIPEESKFHLKRYKTMLELQPSRRSVPLPMWLCPPSSGILIH